MVSDYNRIKYSYLFSDQEAEKRGVYRPTLWKIQKRLIKNPKKFNWKTEPVRKLLS